MLWLATLAVALLLTWQALRAHPLIAPDATTLAALAVTVAATGAALATVLVTTRRAAVVASATGVAAVAVGR